MEGTVQPPHDSKMRPAALRTFGEGINLGQETLWCGYHIVFLWCKAIFIGHVPQATPRCQCRCRTNLPKCHTRFFNRSRGLHYPRHLTLSPSPSRARFRLGLKYRNPRGTGVGFDKDNHQWKWLVSLVFIQQLHRRETRHNASFPASHNRHSTLLKEQATAPSTKMMNDTSFSVTMVTFVMMPESLFLPGGKFLAPLPYAS